MVVAAALIGSLWAGWRLSDTYFSLDEWSMIEQVTRLGKVEGATTSFGGDLRFFQDLIFRIQAVWFGLDSNTFLVVLFLASLVALHLAVAWLAVRVGLALGPALALGGLLTYLGPAAQSFLVVLQLSPTLAAAAGIAATAIVLGGAPTSARFLAVSGLLQLAALLDSGVGLSAVVIGGGVVLGVWPRQSWSAIAPAGLIIAIWYVFGDLGPEFPASVGDRAVFAARVLGRGAGALAGGAAATGFVVLAICTTAVVIAVRSGRLDRSGRSVMIAGGAATMVSVVAIARSQAGVPGFTFVENSRYLQQVALPLTITVLPAFVACAELAKRRWRPLRRAAPSARHTLAIAAIGLCFVAGLNEALDHAEVVVERSELVRDGVQDIGALTEAGCPSGAPPRPDARPLGTISPQVSVRLVDELVDRELLTIDPRDVTGAVDPALRLSVCGP